VLVETEIKLKVGAPGEGRERLERLGAKLVRPRHFEENVLWDDSSGSLLQGGKLLRLRRTPDGATLTFKGPKRVEGGMKARPEIETPVSDPDRLGEILEAVGYKPLFRYQKYRETYAWANAEIVLDETPIGTFFEIEGAPEAIRAAAESLGYSPSEFISESYGALFVAAGGRGDMVFS
jgi:adenylate cyclase class 2